MAGEIPLDNSPLGPHAVLAVMKFAAGERIKDLPEVKKIHGLSLAKVQKAGGAKVPENVKWSRFPGYRVKLGNAKVLAAPDMG